MHATTLPPSGVTFALDLSDRSCRLAAIGPTGDLLEEGVLRCSAEAITARFVSVPPARVVIEAGSHSPWVSRLLSSLGHQVIVANPRKVKLIPANAQKSDRVDAITLARLGRIDPELLAPIHHRPQEAQAALAVIRARNALVRSRTLLINHCRGASKAFGYTLPSCDARYFHRRTPSRMPLALQPALFPLAEELASISARIANLDRVIERLIDERFPDARRLQQVPGVGPLTALTFLLTLADPSRFRRSRAVGSFLGLTPRSRQSGDRNPRLPISKEGDIYLRSLLVEAAHFTLSSRAPDSDLRRWALAQLAASPATYNRTTVALARRLALLLHHLWVTGEAYRPLSGEPL
jgi:transposase